MKTKNKKKVLIITWNFPPKTGGMENFIFNVFKSLSDIADVRVIAPEADFKDTSNIMRPSKKGLFYFYFFGFFYGLKELKKNKDMMILGGSFLVAPLVWILGKISGSKKTCYVHGLDLTYNSIFYQAIVRMFISKLDLIFANSRNTKLIALSKKAPQEKVLVIPPFISDSFLGEMDRLKLKTNEFRSEFGINDKVVVLSVGRLTKRKGIAEFLENCFRVAVEKKKDLVFIIAGDEPKEALVHRAGEKEKILKIIKKYNLENNVFLLGYQTDEEIKKLYHMCDIFIFPVIDVPGDIEGFGIVALEAAVAGKMAIGTRSGGIPDAIEDKYSGILVNSGDYEKMCEKLLYYSNHKDEREKLGLKAYNRVKTEFLYKSVIKKWKKILDIY